MIAGLEPIDGSQIIDNPRSGIVYLPQQQPDLDGNRTVRSPDKLCSTFRADTP